MSSILIIDDEPQIRRMLRVVLEAKDYKVHEAATGADGLVEAATRLPDAIILDLGLPDQPGTEVLSRLREWTQTPVLILSVQDSGEDKVAALDAGADDYVTKPFDSGELLARLRVLLRRVQSGGEPVIECGPLRMDFASRLAWVGANELDLTATEYALLRELARNAGKIITHKQLLASVWGPNAVEQSQYLRVYLSHIRKKLAVLGFPPECIRTETGVGYRLLPPPVE
jgi:two-component system KDP operon response regulator KdpE